MVLKQSLASLLTVVSFTLYLPTANAATSLPLGVVATGTMGPTNPPQPTIPTSINQTSYARLVSLNSIDVCGILLVTYLILKFL